MWVGYIEFDDETGEAIAADYSGLEVPATHGLCFITNYKFRGEWNSDMKLVTNCSKMFYQCANLTSFNSDLSSLTNASEMFYQCTNLTSFNGDLSSLTDGSGMFNGCSKLISFNGDLTSFNGDLSSLTNGFNMFHACTNLTSFNGDLSSLTNGRSMFQACANLTSFNGDLSSLTDGSSMFHICKLDKDSVIRIITCLRKSNTCSSSASLTLGIDSQYKEDAELLEVLGITSWTTTVTIVGHGGGTWTITLQAN